VIEIPETDRELLARAAEWPECPGLQDCSRERLARLAAIHGTDFATALIYDRLLRLPDHRRLFERVHQSGNQARTVAPEMSHRAVRGHVALVPGAFYREHKNTGADGSRFATIAESLNCLVERIPIHSFGSLHENARLIAEWLLARPSQSYVLVSLSKGSADLKVALSLPDAAEAFRNVTAWVSFSGLVEGTPLIAWLRAQPLRRLGAKLLLRFRGHRYSVLEELRHDRNPLLAQWPPIPSQLRIIHVLAFPLRRHLTHPWAIRGYERLVPLGPNDGGGILLADAARLPGRVFPVWGADHYLQPAWDTRPLLESILRSALGTEDADLQATWSANQPRIAPAAKSTA
jgi:hypothetical protein